MTRYFEVTATLETPCCISRDPAMGNEVESLGYIPGSALRGMFADLYFRSGGKPDAEFREVFCSGKVRFVPLYPVGCRPAPLSSFTCKAAPGFWSDHPEGIRGSAFSLKPHGVWDLLFEDIDGFSEDAAGRRHVADGCGAPLKRGPGLWYSQGDHSCLVSAPGASLRVAGRTAVSFSSNQAEQGSLHTQLEIVGGSVFFGVITADEPDAASASGRPEPYGEAFTRLFEEIQNHGPVHKEAFTGRRRAGRVSMRIAEMKQHPNCPVFLNMWPNGNPDRVCIALTFSSDAILVDDLLRPVVTLGADATVLARDMGFPEPDVQVSKAFTAARQVSGWDQPAKIFKPDDVAIVAGSTFLLSVPRSSMKTVEEWMLRVIDSGVGLRRSEGFGQVRFDDELHMAAAQRQGGAL